MSSNVDLWREYRIAFQEFARKVENIQSLKISATPVRQSTERSLLDVALLEAEKARLYYNQCRDALASSLLSRSRRKLPPRPSSSSDFERAERVKVIARFLWEFADRCEGRADEDWYRAERIVRSAFAGESKSQIAQRAAYVR
jgi:DUF2934 family protein